MNLRLDAPSFFAELSMVLKRLVHTLAVLPLLFANGAHWVVLQSVAWTTMLADNLHTRPLSEAEA